MAKIAHLFILIAGVIFISCFNQNNSSVAQSACTISVQDFVQKDLTKAVLIDVRTLGEYNSGHLEGAKLIDVSSSSFRDEVSKLDKTATYYVYCKTGIRSSRAADYMRQSGFTSVCNINGGTNSLIRAGVAMVK